MTVTEVLARLAALEDPKARAVNEKHGDDHGVNLGKLRALAKELKTQQDQGPVSRSMFATAGPEAAPGGTAGQPTYNTGTRAAQPHRQEPPQARLSSNGTSTQALAVQLWATGDTAARLVALLICRPKAFTRDELDTMLREAHKPKVHDWLVNYVVKKSAHAEDLRVTWFADPDPVVASAGWALTVDRVAKKPEGLDLDGLLDVVEEEMRDAPPRLQWAMNHCLAQIGIEHPELRERAVDIGERLEVLKNYPTPPNCTSPFAPVWITEVVRRQNA
ncbi:DNA alkylation repair protein [Lentzea guizhouensis]|uniref:DNA alkylation repair protein n=1 Tax=Lentzea guizhouensis TaxID=1586287 RepID=UPI000A6C7844|nr:DNA alkylation repair protein [Lentzea guizhouensis]